MSRKHFHDSIFADHPDVQLRNIWHSSPWKPYYYKPRVVEIESNQFVSPGNIFLRIYEPEYSGKAISFVASHDTSGDYLGVILVSPSTVFQDAIPWDGQGGTSVPTYNNVSTAGNLSQFFAPGLSYQQPPGLHATDDVTGVTVWSHTITEDDVKNMEKVYDGGIHCWMRMPQDVMGTGAPVGAPETTVNSHLFPMEYLNGVTDFRVVFNSESAFLTTRYNGPAGTFDPNNPVFTMVLQSNNADDIEITDYTTLVYEKWQTCNMLFEDLNYVIDAINTDVDAAGMTSISVVLPVGENIKFRHLRLSMHMEFEAPNTSAETNRDQYIRMSVYPIRRT